MLISIITLKRNFDQEKAYELGEELMFILPFFPSLLSFNCVCERYSKNVEYGIKSNSNA